MENQNQNENMKKPLDHKKSIYNRIENLRRTQTLNNQATLEEKETQMRSRMNLRVSVYDKVKNINSQLNNCKKIKIKNLNFQMKQIEKKKTLKALQVKK